MSDRTFRHTGKDTQEEHKHAKIKSYKIKGNIWFYPTGHNQSTTDKVAYKHPAIFPEQLAADHITSWSNEGDLVFDPFCGSGTTCKMAVLNNRNYLGTEISQEYCDIANERIAQISRRGNK